MKFRKNACSIRSPTRNFRNIWLNMESAQDLEFLLTGFVLSPWIFEAMATLNNQQLFAITHCLLVWFGAVRSVEGLPAGVEIKKKSRLCGKMLLIFCSQIQLSVKSKSAFIKRLVNKVFLPVILKIETAFANSLILSLRAYRFSLLLLLISHVIS